MKLNFKTLESLDNVKKVVTEAGEAIKDSTRNISTSSIPTVLGAAAGAGVGAAASFGAFSSFLRQ